MKRNASIQGLRAIAAFVVFLSHSLRIPELHIDELNNSPFHIFYDGSLAVIIFICLSGFFYYNEETFAVNKYIKSVAKKIKGVYIPYFIVILIGYFISRLMVGVSLQPRKFISF